MSTPDAGSPGETPRPAPADSGVLVVRAWLALIVAFTARGFLVFVASLAAFALLPLLAGFTGSVVQSSSMLPVIAVGDVILSRPFDPDSPVPLGRVITFERTSSTGQRVLILHRVVGVDAGGLLVTAGDANRDADSAPLKKADIVGQAFLRIPFVGLPAYWLVHGDLGWAALWILAIGIAIAVEVLAARTESVRPTTPRHASRRTVPLTAVAHAIGGVAVPAIIVAGLLAAPLGQAATAFTARSGSAGSSWTAAVLAPATRVAFFRNPGNSTGGLPLSIQPVVEIQDAAGHRVTGTRTVEITLTSPAGATLACTSTRVTAGTGLLSFAGCAVDRTGSYTLTARADGLTSAVSAAFVISTGPAAALGFTASPSTTPARSPFATQPVVAIFDAGGNRTPGTNAITLAVTAPGTGALGCTRNPLPATAGSAAFAGCSLTTAGSYTLTASAAGLASAVTASFAITPAPALTCNSQVWIATYSWSPTPYAPTVYHLYVNGIAVRAAGADGWNSYVQLTSDNVPAAAFAQGSATVEVRQVTASGSEIVIGTGTVLLGPANYRTYLCG